MSNKKAGMAMDITTSKMRKGDDKVDTGLVNRLAKEKKPFTKTGLNKKMKKAEENREKIIEEKKDKDKDEVKKAKKIAKKVGKAGKRDPNENKIESKHLLDRTGMPPKKGAKK